MCHNMEEHKDKAQHLPLRRKAPPAQYHSIHSIIMSQLLRYRLFNLSRKFSIKPLKQIFAPPLNEDTGAPPAAHGSPNEPEFLGSATNESSPHRQEHTGGKAGSSRQPEPSQEPQTETRLVFSTGVTFGAPETMASPKARHAIAAHQQADP